MSLYCLLLGGAVRITGEAASDAQDWLGTCCPGKAGWCVRGLAEVEMGDEGQAAWPGTIN